MQKIKFRTGEYFIHNLRSKYKHSGWNGRIRSQNLEIPAKRIVRERDSHREKFADFRVTLYNFLVPVVISFCWSEVIVFWFCSKLNAIWFENSELNHKISQILLAFCKILIYLHKMIIDLKNINCRKSSYSSN